MSSRFVRGAGWRCVLIGVLGMACSAALGQPLTSEFTYQGELRSGGVPATGVYDLRFRLFDAAAGGSQVGPTLCVDNAGVVEGAFSAALDFGAQFGGQRRFLEIAVRTDSGAGCADATGYEVLAPRQAMTAAPNALFAMAAGQAASAGTASTATNAGQLNGQPAAFYQNASNLTAGVLSDGRLAGVYSGAVQFTNAANVVAGVGAGLTGLNASNISGGTLDPARLPTPLALSGTSDLSILFVSNASATGRGIYAAATSTTGPNRGGEFYSASSSGIGVSGYAGAGTGATTGVWGGAASTGGRGVYGEATAGTGATVGVEGRSSSTGGFGVIGLALAPSGTTSGAYATSASTAGRGVYGAATAATGGTYGGEFYAASTSGIGVSGYSGAASGTTYGVWGGGNSPSGFGGYFTSPGVGVRGASTGNDGVVGTTSASGRSGVWATSSALTGVAYGLAASSTSTSGRGVYGAASAAGGSTYGGYFESASTTGNGVASFATAASGINYGVWGQAQSPEGTGVFGAAEAGTGFTAGVGGRSASSTGRGVYGLGAAFSGANHGGYFESRSSGGVGAAGIASSGSGGTTGVRGEAASPNGTGVLGYATSPSGQAIGVTGATNSGTGLGVLGHALNATGRSWGVYGRSDSSSGRGVYGSALATTGLTYGGEFYAASNDGIAVSGYVSPTGLGRTYGVWGESTGSATGYGVYGKASSLVDFNYGVVGDVTAPQGWAVYANGRFAASGTKSFRIDHPLDPENRYLLHYAAEGPEPQNIYNGLIDLDARGEAVVVLPAYFALVNTAPRYTLTAVGMPMPMLHVAREVDPASLKRGEGVQPGDEPPACEFRIAGGAPGGRVSWEVKATRNDRFVRDRGAPVELDKPQAERGRYQHPELYGRPAERGMHDARARGGDLVGSRR